MAQKEEIRRNPGVEPTHPGEILHDRVFPALGLSVQEAAEELGVSRQSLHRILAKKAAVSADMALRIGKLCGNGPEIWASLQASHDLWVARKRLGKKLLRIHTRHVVAA